jgi:hypothetical protein
MSPGVLPLEGLNPLPSEAPAPHARAARRALLTSETVAPQTRRPRATDHW